MNIYSNKVKKLLFTVMVSVSYTSESRCIGIYTSHQEAKNKYLLFLKEDYNDAQNNGDMQEYIENDGFESINDWYEHYKELEDYTIDDGERFSRVTIEYIIPGDVISFNPIELLFDLYKDKLSENVIKELTELDKKEISKSLVRKV